VYGSIWFRFRPRCAAIKRLQRTKVAVRRLVARLRNNRNATYRGSLGRRNPHSDAGDFAVGAVQGSVVVAGPAGPGSLDHPVPEDYLVGVPAVAGSRDVADDPGVAFGERHVGDRVGHAVGGLQRPRDHLSVRWSDWDHPSLGGRCSSFGPHCPFRYRGETVRDRSVPSPLGRTLRPHTVRHASTFLYGQYPVFGTLGAPNGICGPLSSCISGICEGTTIGFAE